MNTDTGQIYEGVEIKQALDRGEPVVPISKQVAEIVRAGQRVMNRQERRARQKLGFTQSRIPG